MRVSKKFCRLSLTLLCFVMLLSPLTAGAHAYGEVEARLRPDVTIMIDGSKRIFYNSSGRQVHPIAYDGTTYLPLRAIGELMGKNVDWNQSTRTATLSGIRTAAAAAGTPDTGTRAKDITAELRDDFTIVIDGAAQSFTDANGKPVYPLLYQGSTYLPVRAIGKLMGKTVAWDARTSTVTLSGSEVTDADTFSGGTVPPSGSGTGSGRLLSAEDAKAKALAHAGIAADQATFTEVKLDWDDGRQIYEIEFYSGSAKYEYEIDAAAGEILSYEGKSGTPQAPGAGNIITREKAREIALAKVPGATADHIKKLKLDREDGRQIYEVEIIYNGVEYEIEIDAVTGIIVDYDVDYD